MHAFDGWTDRIAIRKTALHTIQRDSKTHITDLDKLKEQLRTEWTYLVAIAAQSFFSGVVAYQCASRPVLLDILSIVSDFVIVLLR